MKENYCPKELMWKLISVEAPLSKVGVNNGVIPIFYTKDYDDPDWFKCDAYYRPTVGAVIDWLDSVGYFVNVNHVTNGYGVWVKRVEPTDVLSKETFFFDTMLKAQVQGIKEALDIYDKERNNRPQ